MDKYLFFDDRYLNVITNTKRVMHSPRLITQEPYVDPAINLVNLAWAYPFVYFSETLKHYVMFYQGWSIQRETIANTIALCATSPDGKTFIPFNTDAFFHDSEKILPNQVLPYHLDGFTFAEGQFFYLPQLKIPSKLLALCIYKGPNNVFKAMTFTSEDGLRFTYHPEMAWHDGLDAPDYPISIVYDAKTNTFILYHRPAHTDRRIAMTRTADFVHYTPIEVILQSDCLDAPLTDFYGVTVFDNAPFFIGFVMMYQTPNYLRLGTHRVSSLYGHKFDGGPVNAQLVYSSDGSHFSRSFRKSFFQNQKSGFQCLYPSCVITQKDAVTIYASATSEEHGRVAPGKGCVVAYQLRKDGFISMSTQEKEGELVTRQMLFDGGDIFLNVDSSKGFIQVQIADSDNVPIPGYEYDHFKPFTGNSTSFACLFEGQSLNTLKGKVVVINVRSKNTHLYSIEGHLKLMTPYEAMHYEKR